MIKARLERSRQEGSTCIDFEDQIQSPFGNAFLPKQSVHYASVILAPINSIAKIERESAILSFRLR